jgi:2-iminoacetate synthase ThiH
VQQLPEDLEQMIRESGRTPRRRTTLYGTPERGTPQRGTPQRAYSATCWARD